MKCLLWSLTSWVIGLYSVQTIQKLLPRQSQHSLQALWNFASFLDAALTVYLSIPWFVSLSSEFLPHLSFLTLFPFRQYDSWSDYVDIIIVFSGGSIAFFPFMLLFAYVLIVCICIIWFLWENKFSGNFLHYIGPQFDNLTKSIFL